MPKQATKQAIETPAAESTALAPSTPAQSPINTAAADFTKLVESLPFYKEMKTMTRPQKVAFAATQWFCHTLDTLNVVGSLFTGTASLAEIICEYAPFVEKIRSLAKENAGKEEGDAGRITWKSIGVVPTATYKLHGKEITIKEDDAIGWTSLCAQVMRGTSPQYVNRVINEKLRPALPAYRLEEEDEEAFAPSNPPRSSRNIKPFSPAGSSESAQESTVKVSADGKVTQTPFAKPGTQEEKPAPKMMPIPDLKTGDVDALIAFLNADSVTGAVPPMDAVFAGLSDFDVAMKAGQLARKIVDEYVTNKSIAKVTVTIGKKQERDRPKVDLPQTIEIQPTL